MGGRSRRGIRSPIGYASGYQNSYSHAEITVRQYSYEAVKVVKVVDVAVNVGN